MPEQLCQLLLLRHNTPDFWKQLKLVMEPSLVNWVSCPGNVCSQPSMNMKKWDRISCVSCLRDSVGVIFREKSLNILSHRCILEVCVNFAKGITLRDSALCIVQVCHKYQKHLFLCVLYVKIGTPLHSPSFLYLSPKELKIYWNAKKLYRDNFKHPLCPFYINKNTISVI